MVLTLVSAGVGFVLADGVDRFLATYNPTAAEKPKDKFTSDGAGTLANTLNVSAMPNWKRLAAGVGVAAVPTVGAVLVKNRMLKASFEGMALGAGISAFKTFWNTVVMGKLLKPKDTSTASLQKSYIARLYPAEVAASINMENKLTNAGGTSFGALSKAGDVGPFAGVSGDSAYPDAGQALRRDTGIQDQYPSVQNTWGTGEYPTAAQAMGVNAWEPGPPPGPGPGPQPSGADCGCAGSPTTRFHAFLGDPEDKAAA